MVVFWSTILIPSLFLSSNSWSGLPDCEFYRFFLGSNQHGWHSRWSILCGCKYARFFVPCDCSLAYLDWRIETTCGLSIFCTLARWLITPRAGLYSHSERRNPNKHFFVPFFLSQSRPQNHPVPIPQCSVFRLSKFGNPRCPLPPYCTPRLDLAAPPIDPTRRPAQELQHFRMLGHV